MLVVSGEEVVVEQLCGMIRCDRLRSLVEQQYRLNDVTMKDKLSFTADWR